MIFFNFVLDAYEVRPLELDRTHQIPSHNLPLRSLIDISFRKHPKSVLNNFENRYDGILKHRILIFSLENYIQCNLDIKKGQVAGEKYVRYNEVSLYRGSFHIFCNNWGEEDRLLYRGLRDIEAH